MKSPDECVQSGESNFREKEKNRCWIKSWDPDVTTRGSVLRASTAQYKLFRV
ncbi:hypothetical protein L9F63_025589, partial [Diploptera punctata]